MKLLKKYIYEVFCFFRIFFVYVFAYLILIPFYAILLSLNNVTNDLMELTKKFDANYLAKYKQ
jgi:hypothetical protein